MIIYNKDKTTFKEVVLTDGCVRFRELGGRNYVRLEFMQEQYQEFAKGSYILYQGQTFTLLDSVYPDYDTETGGWKYALEFESCEGDLNRYNLFFHDATTGQKEVCFALTSDLLSYGNLICECINREQNRPWQVKMVGDEWDGLHKTLSFKGEKLSEALTMICESFDCEWWTEENLTAVDLCLGKLEFGTHEPFEMGRVVASMSRQGGDDRDYGTRFYCFGSTRNLSRAYGQIEQGGPSNHVSEVRLRLPDGMPYVDAREGLQPEEIVEQVAFFDDIYPKNTDVVTSVVELQRPIEGSGTYTAYVITADNTPFTKELLIAGQTLMAVFESGSLRGRSYEVSIYGDRQFEIMPQKEGDVLMPNAFICPQPGDTFILTGIQLPEQRIRAAEEQLLEAARSWAQKKSRDTGVYQCQTNPVFCAREDKNYEIGQKVRLVDHRFGPEGRNSRIRAYEKKLVDPYQAEYTVGDHTVYSRLGCIESDIKASEYAERIGSVSGAGIYLIRSLYDNTPPQDHNTYSALSILSKIRTMSLSRQYPDTAAGMIRFLDGLVTTDWKTDNFASGSLGAGTGLIDRNELQTDRLLVRKEMTVLELLVQKMRHQGGQLVLSPAGGKIIRVEEFPGYWKCFLETDNGLLRHEFVVGDQCRIQNYDGRQQKYLWALVTETGEDYLYLSKTDKDGTGVPRQGDDLVQLGHRSNASRQNAVMLSSAGSEVGIVTYENINSFDLSGKERSWFGRHGDKVGAEICGTLRVSSGKTVEEYIDEQIEEIETGGINLMVKEPVTNYYPKDNALLQLQVAEGYRYTKAHRLQRTDSQMVYFRFNLTHIIEESGWYTVEFRYRQTGGEPVVMKADINDTYGESVVTVHDGEWHLYRTTIRAKNYLNKYGFCDVQMDAGSPFVVDISDMVVTGGNTYTGWSPAPEDVEDYSRQVAGGLRNMLKNSKSVEIGPLAGNYVNYKWENSKGCVLKSNTTYTLSVGRTLVLNNKPVGSFSIRLYDSETHPMVSPISGSFLLKDELHYVTFTTPELPSDNYQLVFYTGIAGSDTADRRMRWEEVKLAEGDFYDGWSPAPEDLVTSVEFGVLEDRIEAKVEKTEFDKQVGTLSQNISEVKQTAESWSSVIKEAVDAVQVGGVNLLRDTQHPDLSTGAIWNMNSHASLYGTVGNFTAFKITAQWARLWQNHLTLEVGESYVFSCWMKKDADLETRNTYLSVYKTNTNIVFDSIRIGGVLQKAGTTVFLLSEEYQRLEVVLHVLEPQTMREFRIEFFTEEYQTNTPCGVVYGYKLEKGNKCTDWSPAPQDTETSLAKIQASVSEVRQTAESWGSTITKTEESLKKYTEEKVQSVRVGGTNLFLNTQHPNPANKTIWNFGESSVYGTEKTFTAIKITEQHQRLWQNRFNLEEGVSYSFSCWVKKDDTLETAPTLLSIYKTNASIRFDSIRLSGRELDLGSSTGSYGHALTTGYQRLEVVFTALSVVSVINFRIQFYTENAADTPCGVVYGYKMERGNVPTDWTAAPEDTPEVAARNLIKNSRLIEQPASASEYNAFYFKSIQLAPFKSHKQYVVSVDRTEISEGTDISQFTILLSNRTTTLLRMAMLVSEEPQYIAFTTPELPTDNFHLLFYTGTAGKDSANRAMRWHNVKLAEGELYAGWSPAPEDMDGQAAGRNIIRDSHYTIMPGSGYNEHINYTFVNRHTVPIKSNTTYVLSVDRTEIVSGQPVGEFSVTIFDPETTKAMSVGSFPVLDEPHYFVFTTTDLPTDTYCLRFYTGIGGTDAANRTMAWHNVKLAEGKIYTGWSPAPEDMDGQAAGRNIIRDSKYTKQSSVGAINHNVSHKFLDQQTCALKSDTYYVVSVDRTVIVSGDPVAEFTVKLYDSTLQKAYDPGTLPVSEEPQHLMFRTPELLSDNYGLLFYTGIGGQDGKNRVMEWHNVKLAEGRVYTGWSPAPEDNEASLTEIRTTVSEVMQTAESWGVKITESAESVKKYADGSLEVLEGELKETGIDVKSGEIHLYADRIFVGDGKRAALFEGDKISAKYLDVDDLTARKVMAGEHNRHEDGSITVKTGIQIEENALILWENDEPKIHISSDRLPTLAELDAEDDANITIQPKTITQEGSKLEFARIPIKAGVITHVTVDIQSISLHAYAPSRGSSLVFVSLNAQYGNKNIELLYMDAADSNYPTGGGNDDDDDDDDDDEYEEIDDPRPITEMSLNKSFTVQLEEAGPVVLYADVFHQGEGTFRLYIPLGTVRYQTQTENITYFGSDGIAIVGGNSQYLYCNNLEYRDNPFLQIKGQVDIPGALGAVSIVSGVATVVYGKITGSTLTSTGIYTVSHRIGHSRYMVSVTSTNNARYTFVVSSKTATSFRVSCYNSSGTLAACNFDAVVTGSNY